MQKHCIRTARLYKVAAKVTQTVCETGASVKSVIYKTKHPNTKAIFALVVKTLKRSKQIGFLLKRTKLLEKETKLNPWLARVLITELLWGKQRLLGESKPIKTILAYQQALNAHTSDVHENDSTKIKVTKPRFVRVNTLLKSVEDTIDAFRSEGWTFVRYMDTKNYDGFLDKVANLSEKEFMVDIHIPELLIFPQKTTFYSHDAYKQGSIILQDKASCLPGHLLNPTPGSAVLDMCAAPGMKTSHLAAILKNEGKIFAVDLNEKRLKTLETLMGKNGITCVQAIHKDILKLTEINCSEVKYILVDPSCSGSGMVDRLNFARPTVKDAGRIKKLKGFQIMILKHALRGYPNAQRVVYSTCSLYPEENEEVVQEVIKQSTKFKLINASELLKTPWINVGSEEYGNIGKSCLYAKPEKDLTNGFFVAVFERLKDGEVNEYYVPYDKTESNKRKNPNNENETQIIQVDRKNEKKKHHLGSGKNKRMNEKSMEDTLHSNKSEIIESKEKKHKTENDESEVLNTESSLQKKKMKKGNINSYSNGDENDDLSNLLINDAINNILRKNEEMEKSAQKKNNKMEKKQKRSISNVVNPSLKKKRSMNEGTRYSFEGNPVKKLKKRNHSFA